MKDPIRRDKEPVPDSPAAAHPVGTTLGAVGGGATGATVGIVGGPVGVAVGAAIGAMVGGIAGKAAAEAIHPTPDDKYWREHHERTYSEQAEAPSFDKARRAYHFGWESYQRYAPGDRTFDELEDELRAEWEAHRGNENLDWAQARNHAKDAFDEVRAKSSGAPDLNHSDIELGDESANFDPDADREISRHLQAAEFEHRAK